MEWLSDNTLNLIELIAQLFSQLPDYMIRAFAITCVVILDYFFPMGEKYHPLYFFRLIATRLADKVNPDPTRHKNQLILSGALAMIIWICPLIIIGVLFEALIAFPHLFEAFILWLCLSLHPCLNDHKRVIKALNQGQKLLAQDRLKHWVLRDTDKLSELGVIKASIESVTLRNSYFYHVVLFWYLIGGAWVTLSCRLLLELRQVWNPKLTQFIYFGKAVNIAVNIFAWLPLKLSALSYTIGKGIFKLYKPFKQAKLQWRYSLSLMPLIAMGQALQKQLGGAVIYQHNKVKRPQINSYALVQVKDIQDAIKLIYQSNIIWLIMIVISTSIVMICNQFLKV